MVQRESGLTTAQRERKRRTEDRDEPREEAHKDRHDRFSVLTTLAMTIQQPYSYTSFRSDLSLTEVARRVSEQLFGGVPFGSPDWIDECNSVRLSSEILGCAVYILQLPQG